MAEHINPSDELRQIAERFSSHQKNFEQATGTRLSDNALLRKFPALGSTKTYRLILDGHCDGLSVDRQLTNYRRAALLLDNAQSSSEEIIWSDMDKTERVILAVTEARAQRGVNRFVKVTGRSGFGKTSCVGALDEKFPNEVLAVEADVSTTLPVLLKRILHRLNAGRARDDDGQTERRVPGPTDERLLGVIEALNDGRRRILCIDEAHHLRADSLNGIKTLINQVADLVVVMLGVGTLMKQIEDSASEEAEQLNDNRLYEAVNMEVTALDAERFLCRSLKIATALAKTIAPQMAERANKRRGFRYLRNLVYWTRQAVGTTEVDKVTLDQVASRL